MRGATALIAEEFRSLETYGTVLGFSELPPSVQGILLCEKDRLGARVLEIPVQERRKRQWWYAREIPQRPIVRVFVYKGKDFSSWYSQKEDWKEKEYKEDWYPVMLSDEADKIFIDGYHRFHAYCARGRRRIPAIAFADRACREP